MFSTNGNSTTAIQSKWLAAECKINVQRVLKAIFTALDARFQSWLPYIDNWIPTPMNAYISFCVVKFPVDLSLSTFFDYIEQ